MLLFWPSKILDGCPWGEVFEWLPSSYYGSSWNFQISICIRCPHSRIIYLGLPSRQFFLMFGQKTPFQEVQLETAFFFRNVKKWYFDVGCSHLAHSYLAFTCLLNFFPLVRPRSSSNILRFFKMFFVFHPDVKSTSLFGAIVNWKPSSTSIKTKAPWKGVISQPKGVKTQPKGIIFSVVILMFLKTTSFRQPASQMGVQLFGGWFFDYYVSFFLYVFIQFIIIYVNPQSKNCSWAAGFQENITKKWKGFFCLKRLFFWDAIFFWRFKKRQFFLLPVDLGIDSLLIWLNFSIALHQWVTGWQGVLATTQRRRLFTQDFQQLYRSFPGLGTVKKESWIDDSQQIEAIRDSRQ